MKRWLIVFTLIIILVVLGTYFVYQNIMRMKITTSPVIAQVFLDGKLVGETPYFLQTVGRRSLLVEIKADGFFPVSYQFNSQNYSAPNELAIHLLPTFYHECSMSEDWNVGLCENKMLVNAQNPNDTQQIARLGQEGNVYYSVLSPDGKMIAYATKGEQYNKFWLLDLSRVGDATPIFENITSDTTLIRAVPLEFSPNSEWISLQSNGTLLIAPVSDPQSETMKFDDVSDAKWSNDGQWLAVFLYSERQTVIYHYLNNQWTLYSKSMLTDVPVAFSPDNHYLFMKDWQGAPWLKIIDVSQMQLAQRFTLEGDSDQIFNPKVSHDRMTFAVVPNIFDSKTRIQTTILLFGRFDKDVQAELNDESYQEVLYWLEGDKQVATLVKRKTNDTADQIWMRIVDVPAKLSR